MRSKHRTFTLALLLTAVSFAFLTLSGCDGCNEPQRYVRRQVHKEVVHTYHMSTGEIAYQNNAGAWYWYTPYSPTQAMSSGARGYWEPRSYSPFTYPRPGVTVTTQKLEEEKELEEETGVSELPEEPQLEETVVEENVPASEEPSSAEGEPSPNSTEEPSSSPSDSPSDSSPSSDSSSSSSDSGSSPD